MARKSEFENLDEFGPTSTGREGVGGMDATTGSTLVHIGPKALQLACQQCDESSVHNRRNKFSLSLVHSHVM